MIDFVKVGMMALVGLLTAVLIDLDAFIASRDNNPEYRFDWAVALPRWIKGVILGLLGGLGYNGSGL
jgi:hypothetical protein